MPHDRHHDLPRSHPDPLVNLLHDGVGVTMDVQHVGIDLEEAADDDEDDDDDG